MVTTRSEWAGAAAALAPALQLTVIALGLWWAGRHWGVDAAYGSVLAGFAVAVAGLLHIAAGTSAWRWRIGAVVAAIIAAAALLASPPLWPDGAMVFAAVVLVALIALTRKPAWRSWRTFIITLAAAALVVIGAALGFAGLLEAWLHHPRGGHVQAAGTVGMIVLAGGASLLVERWQKDPTATSLVLWSTLMALALALPSIGLWHHRVNADERQVEALTATTLDDVVLTSAAAWRKASAAIDRLADLSSRGQSRHLWAAHAAGLLNELPGVDRLAVMDDTARVADGRVASVAGVPDNAATSGQAALMRTLALAGDGQSHLSDMVATASGGHAQFYVVPMTAAGGASRFLVARLDVGTLIGSALHGIDTAFGIELSESRVGRLYVREASPDGGSRRFWVSHVLDLPDQAVRVTVWPGDALAPSDAGIALPLGALVTALGSALLYTALRSRRRAARLAILNQQVRQSSGELEDVLRSIIDGLVSLDDDGRVVFLNDRARSLLALAEAAEGDVLWTMLPPPLTERLLRRALAGEAAEAARSVEWWSAGTARWLELRVSPHGDGLTVLVRDITESRALTRRLLERERQLSVAHRIGRLCQMSWVPGDDGFEMDSDALLRLGLGSGESIHQLAQWLDRVHPQDRSSLEAGLRELGEHNRVLEMEYRLIQGERIVYVQSQAEWLPDGDGGRIIATVQDISVRKQNEVWLAGHAEVLHTLAAGADLHDVLERIVRLMESQKPQMIGSILLLDNDGVHMRDGAGANLPVAYRQAINGAAIGPAVGSCGTAMYRGETVIVSDIDNDPLWADYRGLAALAGVRACWSIPIRTAGGRIAGTFAMYFKSPRAPALGDLELIARAGDLAGVAIEHLHTRDRLRRSELRFRSLFEQHPDAGFAIGADDRIERVNPALLAATGFSESALIHRPLSQLFPPAVRVELARRRDRVRAGDAQFYRTSLMRCERGVLDVALTLMPIVESNRITGFYGVARDITDDVARELALNRAMQDLERSNRELQDFAFVASHDLQEPLRKILTFGERLTRGDAVAGDAEAADYAGRMMNAATRMQRLIADLLAYSRVTTRGQDFEAVDLQSVVLDVVADLEALIERSGGRVDTGPLPTVQADRTQMGQLLQNLIANGLKFARVGEPPVVKVRARQAANADGAHWVISVSDNGIGFDPRHQQRIFAPFGRLHPRDRYEGTGIGLAIVSKIVTRHGGRIMVDSTPGQGSTFTVWLSAQPVAEHPSPASAVS